MMEKLEVRQVWKSKTRVREIRNITANMIVYHDSKSAFVTNNVFESTFQQWIARTGAKLEGRSR